MKKAAVVADNYKLKTFRKNLKNAGFKWEESVYNPRATILNVDYNVEDFGKLQKIVRESNDQTRKKK